MIEGGRRGIYQGRPAGSSRSKAIEYATNSLAATTAKANTPYASQKSLVAKKEAKVSGDFWKVVQRPTAKVPRIPLRLYPT